MSTPTTIARPYANAAFQYALAHNQINEWGQVLAGLGPQVATSQMQLIIGAPKVSKTDLAQLLIDLAGNECTEQMKNFLRLLVAERRVDLLPFINVLYRELQLAHLKVIPVEVTSARPLSDAQRESLKTALMNRFNEDVTLTFHEDETLLGGAVIRTDKVVIDGSIRSKLLNLHQDMRQDH